MDWIKTSQCCCGFSLIGGTIVMLIVGLLIDIPYIIAVFMGHLPLYNIGLLIIIVGVEIVGLYGAVRRNRIFLFPYLIYRVIGLFVVVITTLFYIVLALFKREWLENVDPGDPLFLIIPGIISSGVFFHYMQVVYSLYSELRTTNTEASR